MKNDVEKIIAIAEALALIGAISADGLAEICHRLGDVVGKKTPRDDWISYRDAAAETGKKETSLRVLTSNGKFKKIFKANKPGLSRTELGI